MADKFVGNFPLGGQGRMRRGPLSGKDTPDMREVLNAGEALDAYVKRNGVGATNAINPKQPRHFGRGVPADSVLALESESQNED